MSPRTRVSIFGVVISGILVATATAAAADPLADPAQDSTAAWVQDLDVLDAKVRALHPAPFVKTPETVWAARVRDLKDTVGALSPTSAKVAITKLVALLDTHAGVFPEEIGMHFYGDLLWGVFEDGVFVTEATAPELVGAQVLAIGNMPIDLALAAVRPLVNADNESAFKDMVPWIALVPEFLEATGVISDVDHPGFVLRRPDGVVTTTDLPILNIDEWSAQTWTKGGFDDSLPDAVARRDEPVWWRVDAPSHTMLVAYNGAGVDVTAALAAFHEAMDAGKVDRLVLDMRYARGGGYHPSLSLVDALASEPRIDRPDRLTVIIGREDVSATTALASRLEQDTHATFVGEPTPARPNTLLDETTFGLPISGITVHIPTTLLEIAGPADTRDAVRPDIPVDLLASDYFAGRDAALEVALRPR